MSGEKILEPSMGVGNFGSPPRGRGKGGFPCLAVLHPGITPAWAGKSNGRPKRQRRRWDHPRVGGEKS